MVDDTVTPPVTAFNSEAGLAVLNYWDELLNQEKVYELGFEDGFGETALKGKVAICFNGPWALKSLDGVSEKPLRCTGTARGARREWVLSWADSAW